MNEDYALDYGWWVSLGESSKGCGMEGVGDELLEVKCWCVL